MLAICRLVAAEAVVLGHLAQRCRSGERGVQAAAVVQEIAADAVTQLPGLVAVLEVVGLVDEVAGRVVAAQQNLAGVAVVVQAHHHDEGVLVAAVRHDHGAVGVGEPGAAVDVELAQGLEGVAGAGLVGRGKRGLGDPRVHTQDDGLVEAVQVALRDVVVLEQAELLLDEVGQGAGAGRPAQQALLSALLDRDQLGGGGAPLALDGLLDRLHEHDAVVQEERLAGPEGLEHVVALEHVEQVAGLGLGAQADALERALQCLHVVERGVEARPGDAQQRVVLFLLLDPGAQGLVGVGGGPAPLRGEEAVDVAQHHEHDVQAVVLSDLLVVGVRGGGIAYEADVLGEGDVLDWGRGSRLGVDVADVAQIVGIGGSRHLGQQGTDRRRRFRIVGSCFGF
ncbi:hypothetical protein PGQ11_009706 [Apiospora arundinis]|uniref:Uncharacterized protein n=1 Tax=Apiospora arundinis TaxID=335852 RepID=A0ABR2I8K8_9PEZI